MPRFDDSENFKINKNINDIVDEITTVNYLLKRKLNNVRKT